MIRSTSSSPQVSISGEVSNSSFVPPTPNVSASSFSSPSSNGPIARSMITRRLPPLANVKIDSTVSPEIRDAIDPVMYALGPLLPAQFNTIHVTQLNAQPGQTAAGYTEPRPETNSVKIELAAPEESTETHVKVGRAAQTFAHEVYLHAFPFFMSKKAAHDAGRIFSLDDYMAHAEAGDHIAMYSPPDNTNGFFAAICKVLQFVPSASRQAFLEEYVNDLENNIMLQLNVDEHGAVFDWHAELASAAHNPDASFWRAR